MPGQRTIPGPRHCDDCGQAVTAKHWYASGQPRCWRRRWTMARRWRLMEHIERGLTDVQIAARMETTAAAVNLVRKRDGIPCRQKTLLSAGAVAAKLGLGGAKTVAAWIRAGWLRGRRGQRWGANRQWYVRVDDVLSFLDDEAHWHRWRWERIADPFLRRYACKRRGEVRFLSVGQVADRFRVNQRTVHSWIQKGYLPAVRNGNWLVREADAAAFVRPPIGGRRNAACRGRAVR